MQAIEALQRLDRAVRFAGGGRHELKLVIPVVQPGSVGSRPMVPAARIDQGAWDKNRVFVVPAVPVARHMPLQTGPMPFCAQSNGGFAAAQRETQLLKRIAALEQELSELRASRGS